jgi:uncharacterized membrane protein YfcA
MSLALPALLGLIVGLTLGALGGGGSILTVPMLVYVLGEPVSVATTGSLIIVGVAALFGWLPRLRSGQVLLGRGVTFGVLGILGALLGAHLSAAVPPEILMLSFASVMLVVAGLMWRRAGRPEVAGHEPVLMVSWRPFRCDCPRVLKLIVTASGVGVLTGFLGVGGGFAVVPALVMVLGLTMPEAVATSLVVITINSATALFARLALVESEPLDWWLIGTFTLAAGLGGVIGGRVASRLPSSQLSKGFAVMLVLVATYSIAHTALTT